MIAIALVVLAYGGYVLWHLPIDVFPDLNRPRVTIITEAHGMAPEEVETLITFPLESVLNGASGVQADGSCMGKCQGKCTPPAGTASASCEGTCEGKCDAKCEASAGVKFTCDGKCTGDFEAPKCEGGKAEVDCEVDADCKANCSASASAKADCKPPELSITAKVTGTATVDAQAQIDAGIASLKANLPKLLVVLKARGESFTAGIKGSVDAGANLTANIGDLSGEAVFCLPPIVAAVGDASGKFATAFKASGEVVASVGVK